MLRSRLPLFALSLLLAPVAEAAEAGEDDITTLDTIVVSGGLTPIIADAYARAHSVVTSDDISARGIRSIQDALRAVPGVSVSSSGTSNTQIRIRGSESSHVLILIDGVRASAGDGAYVLTGLEADNIARIEVLRGPQSVFYGSDASAGVINIITQEAEFGQHGGAGVEVGNGWAASLRASVRDEGGGLSFTASTRDDRGYDHSASGGDKDGIRRHSVTLSGDRRVTDDMRLGFSLRRSSEHYGYDGTAEDATDAAGYVIDRDDYADRNEFGAQIFAEVEATDGRLVHRLSYDQSRLRIADKGQGPAKGRADAWKYRAIWGLDGAVSDARQTFAFGLERHRDENSLATEEKRRSTSVALEYRGNFDALDVQAGLRHDRNSVFENATTWSLGLSYRLAEQGLRLHASAGSGVVNPSYLELFGGWGAIGNPDLHPEKNRGFDFGIEAEILDGHGLIDVTLFSENMKDRIVFSDTPLPDGTNYYNKVGTSSRRGVEIEWKLAATDDLTIGGSYTWLRARDPDGSVAIRRPRHEFGLNAQWRFAEGRGILSGDLRHVAGLWDTQWFGAGETKKLPSYTVANIAASYEVTPNARLTGRVVNLFDKNYQDVWGYASQGRVAWIGLETRW